MPKYTDPEIAKRFGVTKALTPIDVILEDGEPLRVAVRLLSDSEIDLSRQQAQLELRAWAKARGYDPAAVVDIDPEIFERFVQRQMIWRAFYDPETIGKDKPEQFFPTWQDVGMAAGATVHSLWATYLEHQARVTARRLMTPERAREAARSLISSGVAPALAMQGAAELAAVVHELVAVVQRLDSKAE